MARKIMINRFRQWLDVNMLIIKLSSYIIVGIGLFFFGFTFAAFRCEPAIEVLGVIAQYLLFFVALLGVDEWHRQFKFKRRWERLGKEINSLSGMLLSIDSIQDSLLAYHTLIGSNTALEHRELALPLLESISAQSKQIMKIYVSHAQSVKDAPIYEELSQLVRCTKIEYRFLRDLSNEALLKKSLLSTAKHDGASLIPGANAPHHQITLVKLINKYGIEQSNWKLRDWAEKEIIQSKKTREQMER